MGPCCKYWSGQGECALPSLAGAPAEPALRAVPNCSGRFCRTRACSRE
jgi:hypothetical protein